MSSQLQDRVWELDLPAHLQSVLLILARHAHDDGGGAFPSRELMARKLGKTERSVQRALGELRARKLIQPVGGGHRGRATEYTLLLFNGAYKAARAERLFAPERETQRETRVAKKGRRPRPERETPASPRSNPKNTPQIPTVSVRTRHRDEAFEALAEVTGTKLSELTDESRGPLNRALKSIRKAMPELNGDLSAEIRARAARYEARDWGAATPSALAKHWPTLGTDRAPPRVRDRAAEIVRNAMTKGGGSGGSVGGGGPRRAPAGVLPSA